MLVSKLEEDFCRQLQGFPKAFNNRYTEEAHSALLQLLFRSLAGNRDDLLSLFFPQGTPNPSEPWSLSKAQGAVEGAEYTEAARGHPCGHIFKTGEATYRCKTCTVDDTCVLCAKCFDNSDHEGHTVFVAISPGNSGCCDCGDQEAFTRPVHCNIHSLESAPASKSAEKAQAGPQLPAELLDSIRTTIARALDYFCDVFSCSPEQLRLPKTEESIRKDEKSSRLNAQWYGGLEESESEQEFCLVLWNDEKHTVEDVKQQVARACKQSGQFGWAKAVEVDDVGRAVVVWNTDLSVLLRMAKIIEEIKLTVTIRSARDTFREQMCATIVEWIHDIAGCSVGSEGSVLRSIICEEMLKGWRVGSEAHHQHIGSDGLDDHECEDYGDDYILDRLVRTARRRTRAARPVAAAVAPAADYDEEDDDDDADNEWDEEEQGERAEEEDEDMEIDLITATRDGDGDVDMEISDIPEDELETGEATLAGIPPPPPPPPLRRRDPTQTPVDSEAEPMAVTSSTVTESEMLVVPPTPRAKVRSPRPPRPPKYWLEKPEGYRRGNVPLHEDLWQRVRLDYMILYDLRMWKKVRIDLRDVFISTVVTIPYFKRILGLRFAGLYTTLAQLYLIADREPDHSIINLSLQMLTTPSITAEVVERGNFLTNLMAILYTFLTTRQVGYPWDINPMATLAFEAGAVTNRRMYHFFLDMKYLLGSEFVKEKLAAEERYLLQFLDLVKLHQGICPNVRAVGEHIEYETDAWISASLITREINKLCRQFSEAFSTASDEDDRNICRAIRNTAKIVIIHSLGSERKRFEQAEIQQETRFKLLEEFEFEGPRAADHHKGLYPKIVDFEVAKEPMSFHHALHYTLSWLVDRAKNMPRDKLYSLLTFTPQQLKEPPVPLRASIPDHIPDEYLLALFDFPLRVCAWLTQMRAGIWVRNGITLRHQMSTYRGVLQRDVSFQRDIFLLQTALVICPTTQFLAQMVDRFGMLQWAQGDYTFKQGFEDHQIIDVAEDFIHLLIILLSDRTALLSGQEESDPQIIAMRRDIIHILCFKPLSHSDLTNRLPDKIQDHDEFADVLQEMTRFRPPEGLSDTGTFELKEKYIEDIDPYIAQYNRNQREEAETIYKNYVAKKTGKQAADIVFEPKLRHVSSGVFKDLSQFTRTPLFTQIVYYFLGFALVCDKSAPNIPSTRVESYVQFVLQLLLTAVLDDQTSEDGMVEGDESSFTWHLLHTRSTSDRIKPPTILAILHELSGIEAFKACEPKIRTILHRLQQKRPKAFVSALTALNISPDRIDTASPAIMSQQEKDLKKKEALERQARVMAQFKEQQSKFMANQAIDWGEDFSDLEDDIPTPVTEQEKLWKYPSGTCILCQEQTNDQKVYGTFAFIAESSILRQTPTNDPDWVEEVLDTPNNLDRSAEAIRPFGVANKNRRMVTKTTSEGRTTIVERQELGKGFPQNCSKPGPVATGCGHIMHYSCFEVYINATIRRHGNQIARAHPERPEYKEFLCPLCKALGNAFLPIIWKGKTESYPGVLDATTSLEDWLGSELGLQVSKMDKSPERGGSEASGAHLRQQRLSVEYGSREMIPLLGSQLADVARRNFPILPPVAPMPGPSEELRRMFPAQVFAPLLEPVVASSEAGAPSLQSIPILELFRIYQRIRETMKANGLASRYSYLVPPPSPAMIEDLTYTDTLARTLGHSIAAVEIAQRGVESDVGLTLLDKVSSQSLTHLRILSETVSSYIAIGGIRNDGNTKANQELIDTQTRQLNQLFVGHHQLFDQNALHYELKSLEPLLAQDAFVFLTECSVCMVPTLQMDIHHVLRLCYFAEIVRVIMAFSCDDRDFTSMVARLAEERFGNSPASSNETSTFEKFVNFATSVAAEQGGYASTELPWGAATGADGTVPSSLLLLLRKALSSYALPFLRKAVILMHTRYGVDFPFDISNTQLSELERLSQSLKLPSLDSFVEEVMSDRPTGSTLRSLMTGWIRHWMWAREGKPTSGPSITLSHPAIFELVGLPKNYDMLTDEAIKRRCATTGKDITDPCLCLFCGQIFCGQAVCCMKDKNRGGCNQHMRSCGINSGIFINIRKCTVLFLHMDHGCFAVAPYLDSYGEVDPSLRRHHQLFLHQKRYDKLLREVWLNHGIPSTIARRLEGEVNNGGWETL